MAGFDARIEEFWRSPVDESRHLSIVRRIDGLTTVVLSAGMAEQLHLAGASPYSEREVLSALADARIRLHDPDNLFYFDEVATDTLTAEANAPAVRKLAASDQAEFARFEAAASEQDLDDAFVELDHWAVFGAFDGDHLVAVASAYPWRDSQLADIGVLTLDEFRGRGFAKQVVRALSRFALDAGYEPQYRCQLDNVASITVAKSAGLTLYGTWQTVSPDSEA